MSRTDFHSLLCIALGSTHVYYQPPTGFQLSYPCIIYSRDGLSAEKADNTTYVSKWRYNVLVVSKTPDHSAVDNILAMPYAEYERHYTDGQVHYDSIKIYA